MSRKKRVADLQQAKDRRMKKIAIGGAVLFAVVLAFEMPKVLNKSGSSSSPPPATTTDGSPTAPGTTAPGTAAAAVTPVASTKLPNSDSSPKAGKSQLYSFSHFTAKDPFAQQVDPSSQGLSPSGSSSSSAPAPSQQPPASGQTVAVRHHASSRTLAQTGAARIAINGRVQVVRVGGSFPSANPLFRLVSVSRGVARIGIASGSYSSGARTVSLVAGRSLTLVDTADGIRYQLRLLA